MKWCNSLTGAARYPGSNENSVLVTNIDLLSQGLRQPHAQPLASLRFQLPSWNRRGGAKRRGGSPIQKFPFLQLPPLAGSASRSRCPPILGGQFDLPHFKLDHSHFHPLDSSSASAEDVFHNFYDRAGFRKRSTRGDALQESRVQQNSLHCRILIRPCRHQLHHRSIRLPNTRGDLKHAAAGWRNPAEKPRSFPRCV